MRTISESVYELLMAQGLARGTGATVGPCVDKGPALSTKASSGEVVASAAGGTPHQPTVGGESRPMRISGKGTGAATAPASKQGQAFEPSMARSHPVLQLVVSNKDVRRRGPTSVAPLGLRTSLVLIQGGRA